MSDDQQSIDQLAALLNEKTATVLTGAGMSTDSGIPDYRGAGSVPRSPMSIEQFFTDPNYRQRFWAGASVSQSRQKLVTPNAGHRAIVALEAAGVFNGVITQNVDNLHIEAGSRTVVELHGNGNVVRCVDCESKFTRAEVIRWFDAANPGYAASQASADVTPDSDAAVSDFEGVTVPACPVCGGLLRPEIVYFGEHAPRPVFEQAEALLSDANALLIAGSSLAVNTGIRLVHRAEQRGIPIAVINRGPTAIDNRATLRIEGGTSEILAGLAERLL